MTQFEIAALYGLVDLIRENRLPSMTDEERKEFFDKLTEGYCIHCGGPSPCHCQNDE